MSLPPRWGEDNEAMTSLPQGKGFTLIELLVVVLIIGILAAVALPQYNKAVLKARLAEYEMNLKTIAEASQLCRLRTGNLCTVEELDIEIPSCSALPGITEHCEYHIVNSSNNLFNGSICWCQDEYNGRCLLRYWLEPKTIEVSVNPVTKEQKIFQGLLCSEDGRNSGECTKLGFTKWVAIGYYSR